MISNMKLFFLTPSSIASHPSLTVTSLPPRLATRSLILPILSAKGGNRYVTKTLRCEYQSFPDKGRSHRHQLTVYPGCQGQRSYSEIPGMSLLLLFTPTLPSSPTSNPLPPQFGSRSRRARCFKSLLVSTRFFWIVTYTWLWNDNRRGRIWLISQL